jgi:hypothetical protein
MECINSARALLQAAADDSYVVLDSNPSAAAAPTAAASAAPWQDTQEIQILLSLLGAYLLFFGQVKGNSRRPVSTHACECQGRMHLCRFLLDDPYPLFPKWCWMLNLLNASD